MTSTNRPLLIDMHSHVYLPSYMAMLRKRTRIPRVHTAADGQERVILLKEEEAGGGDHSQGRPVGPQYWDRKEKIAFMDTHGIDVTIVSLANPWFDFLEPDEAVSSASELNIDIESYCATYSSADAAQSTSFVALTEKRLFAFGSLPLVPGVEIEKVLEAIKQVQSLPHLRGVVMGTKGLGKGLDDQAMEPIWAALAAAELTIFVHPHYGVEGAFGEQDNGHVLALALGFPFETTIAIARLILFGVLDRHPTLRLLLAHSAGALPALSSRLASCVVHDPTVKDRLQHDFRYYLGMLYYDAVAYGPEELALVERTVARADKFEGKEEQLAFVGRVRERKDFLAPPDSYPGADRIFFGTDHPFFPPLDGEGSRWKSVDENLDAIEGSATPGSSTGEHTPAFDISEEDPWAAMGGLSDLLIVVDAHLELWTRGLRKRAVTIRETADRLVEESKARAHKIPRIKLPRVNSETLLAGMLDESREIISISAKDKEKLERKYRELRQKTRESLRLISVKWEEEKTVRLRDKISFFFGVMNVLVSALLLGFAPDWIPFYYTAQIAVYLPVRVYDYRQKLYHYFLFDLCYAVNLLCLVYLWILPGNPYLFEACYGLTLGTLGSAIAMWRNSLVFHSMDKVISLAIHIFPPLVFTTIRHFYPNANARYPALDHLEHLRPWRSMLINMSAYLVWQVLYYYYVIVARKEKIKQGRATSFTFLINDKKRLVGKIALKVPAQYREFAFMAGQAVYTFITLLPPIFVLYDSKFWSSVYLLILFGVSVWNGGSFYLEVFGRKFEKELIALRKEFEEQQIALQKTTVHAQPQSSSSSPDLATLSSDMTRSTSLDGVAEAHDEHESESSSGSLDGVIEVEQGAKDAVGSVFGKEGLGEVAHPQGAVDEATRHA
ncbi:hypothetical protein RQP46_003276 [Phenoliferia psychrophenolica]